MSAEGAKVLRQETQRKTEAEFDWFKAIARQNLTTYNAFIRRIHTNFLLAFPQKIPLCVPCLKISAPSAFISLYRCVYLYASLLDNPSQ